LTPFIKGGGAAGGIKYRLVLSASSKCFYETEF
jgi:hypothetical protein